MKQIRGGMFFCAAAIMWGAVAGAAPMFSIYSIEDTDVRNDNGGGAGNPNGVNNRSDFMEVRNLVPISPATAIRKRVAYVKFDISALEPFDYDSATISFSFADNRNGAGVMSVYGLNDAVVNPDSAAFSEANWFSYHASPFDTSSTVFSGVPTPPADGLSWSKGLGVDPTILTSDTSGNLGINPAEATFLGVINVPGAQNDMVSNTVDLPLGDFLAADTNGVVTFFFTGTPTEWRIRARENVANGHLSTRLNGELVPEPASIALFAFVGFVGLATNRRIM